jgi:hypothetical protein
MDCSDAEDAGAKDVMKGIMLLVCSSHYNIILELDCSREVVAQGSSLTDRSVQWPTYDRARLLIKVFSEFRVDSDKRESNKVADCLAKLARSIGSCI